jgi:hypothetical protein
LPNFSAKIYEIAEARKTHPNTYILRDLSDDVLLNRAFYGEELSETLENSSLKTVPKRKKII